MKITRPFRPSDFIVLTLQTVKNNKPGAINSRSHSIVLKCLERVVKRTCNLCVQFLHLCVMLYFKDHFNSI